MNLFAFLFQNYFVDEKSVRSGLKTKAARSGLAIFSDRAITTLGAQSKSHIPPTNELFKYQNKLCFIDMTKLISIDN